MRCAWVALAVMLGPIAAFAQSVESPVCHQIRRGETAVQVARRLTGDGWNAYQTWFQIKNASSRFIPKSQYDRIRPGWRACLTKPVVLRARATEKVVDAKVVAAIDESALSTPPQNSDVLAAPSALAMADTVAVAGDTPAISVASDAPRAIRAIDLTMMWLGAALIVPWFGWRFVDGYLVRKKTTTIVMRHFAERFVREFERPLVLDDARRPLRTRVRYNARRGRLDILLAPGVGRRYPNLTDHKKNVEYDVERIVHALADESFVSGALFTQAGWVVVPFRFHVRRSRGEGGRAEQQQSGVSCISSL